MSELEQARKLVAIKADALAAIYVQIGEELRGTISPGTLEDIEATILAAVRGFIQARERLRTLEGEVCGSDM